MGETTKIQWCDHTFNPWRGCTKVAPGCANCYADAQSKRNPKTLGVWGPNGTRVVAAEKTWGEPLKWNAAAEREGVRRRVFCASLADVFEDWDGRIHNSAGREVWVSQRGTRSWEADDGSQDFAFERKPLTMDDLRARLFALIDATPHLDWLLVTKRPQNVRRMWPAIVEKSENWFFFPEDQKARGLTHAGPHASTLTIENGYRENVWLLTSVSDQATYDAAAPHLEACGDLVPVIGYSGEPLLGPITLGSGRCDWFIAGGESGHNARPCDLAWIRSIVGQCSTAGVPCFVKQLGARPVYRNGELRTEIHGTYDGFEQDPPRDPKGGDWNEWPNDLRVREWPKGR